MPQFDKATVDALISTLESGEADLQNKTQANTDAVTKAAQTTADLTASQATNLNNVIAVKAYFASLADDGSSPSPTILPDPPVVMDPNALIPTIPTPSPAVS